MGSVLTISMVVLTVLPIIFGLLLGLLRGSRRALLRLGLVILSLILAFALRNVITDKVFNAEFTMETESGPQTMTLSTFFTAMLGEEAAEMGITELIIPVVKTLMNIVVFLTLFGIFEFITWAIVFPICQIFVKPKIDTEASVTDGSNGKVKRKYYRLAGAGIGALQGFLVAVCVCVLLTGVIVQSNKLIVAASEISSSNSSESSEEFLPPEMTAMVDEYLQSGTGKFYNTKTANKIVSWVSGTKIDGEKKTLPGQVDALTKLLKLVGQLGSLQDTDMGNLFNGENENAPETIRDFFYGLDDLINGEDTTEETRKTINKAIGNFVESMGKQFDLPIDVTGMDFTDIDFRNEGDLISDLYDYTKSETITKDDVENILDKVVKSELVLPILANSDVNMGEKLSDDQLDQVEEILDNLEGVSESKMESIRKLFGLD